MNTHRKLTLLSVLLLIAFALLLATPPVRAQAPINKTLTNLPAILETGSLSNLTSQPIDILPGRGIGLELYFAGTNAGTANVVANCDLSKDGINWTTEGVLKLVTPMTGTTAKRAGTNFPPWLFDGWRKFRVTSLTNAHTASVFPTNATITRANQ